MKRWIEAFGNAGQEEFEPQVVVRIRALNIATVTITLAMAALVFVMLMSDEPEWNDSGYTNLWLLLLLQPVLVAHKLGYLTKALYFFAWIALFVVVGASFGRINATHIALLVMPSIAVYVLGVRRWILAAVLSVFYTLLFLGIEYFVPWQVGWHQTFFEAISAELPTNLSLGMYDLIFITVVLVTEATVFLGAFLTLSALRKSQDALAR